MNPDRELVREFLRSGTQSPISITTNPLACALNLTLIEARAQPGRAVLHCDPLPLFVQGAGVLQGGALGARPVQASPCLNTASCRAQAFSACSWL
ncbi:MAG: acyl-CoA dehydrogenase [Gammaproteobacteria bacterium]|nr:acyl-CoA dehydrogenase [Gammaproteobacteria bacterium]